MPSQPATCEAATASGQPCRGTVHHVVDLGELGRVRLCGSHVRMARRGRFAPWVPGQAPPPKRRYTVGAVWSSEDDAEVVAAGVPDAELAPRLGRTVGAVRHRRYVLRRRPWAARG